MVASSLSSTVNPPPLSYAERAKKAQNIKSPIEVIPQSHNQRTSHHHPPLTPITPSLSSTSATSAKSSSSVLTSLLPSPASVQSSIPQTPLPRPPHLPESNLINGDSHTPPTSPPTKPLPSVIEIPPSPHKQPPVNVWDRRKEEFAARNASGQKLTPTTTPTAATVAISVLAPTTASQSSSSASRLSAVASVPSSSSRADPVQTDHTALPTETSHQSSATLPADNNEDDDNNDDDDDPFVVRTDRAPRPRIPVPCVTLPQSNSDEWPEVGKPAPASVAASSTENGKLEESKSITTTTGDNAHTRKAGGAHKWVPLPLDPHPNVQQSQQQQQQQRRDSQSAVRGNRQQTATNSSRPPSITGQQNRNSRSSQSGRTSTNQSAANSRVHSNVGSAQSSPRNPRHRRLPGEELPAGAAATAAAVATTNVASTPRSSRTGSPHHPNPLLQGPSSVYPSTDIPNLPTTTTNYGSYLSPTQGASSSSSSYYPQQPQPQPPLPPVNPAIYHSPSHAPPPGLPSDPLVHPAYSPYVYPTPPYIPYEYLPQPQPQPQPHSAAPYPPYWNSHPHSHPSSGRHSPAAAAAYPQQQSNPYHVQQPHFYSHPPPPSQQVHSSYLGVSGAMQQQQQQQQRSPPPPPPPPETNTTTTTHTDNNTQKPTTSVVFGSINDISTIESPSPLPLSPAPPPADIITATTTDAKDNIEKVFKKLAIGIDSTDALVALKARNKSATKLMGNHSGGENVKGEDGKLLVNGGGGAGAGDIVVDPVLVKEATAAAAAGSTGEMKWTFGNEGLASPVGGGAGSGSGGAVVEVEESTTVTATATVQNTAVEGLGKEFEPRYHHSGGSSGPTDTPPTRDGSDADGRERIEGGGRDVESTERLMMEDVGFSVPPGPSNGRRGRGTFGYGYDRGGGGYPSRRGRINGYSRGGGYRGYNRGGGGGSNSGHNHNGNPYSTRPPFSITPPPPFQGIPSPMDGGVGGSYYPGPLRPPPLTTYIPTGYDPYAPLPPPPPPPQPQQQQQQPGVALAPAVGSSSPSGHAAPPPMPIPLSNLGYQLDATRYYLLGQLEYYLSPQNMAQDFYLRQHMDSKGWIPIGLLASFNRVKQLTQDYQLVREVLMFSSLVQWKDHFVRMGGWEQFVLPDAPKSSVEASEEVEDYSLYIPQANPLPHHAGGGGGGFMMDEMSGGVMMADFGGERGGHTEGQQQWSHPVEGDEEVEEEEEDDVVFVMGNDEGEGMWSHEKRT